MILVAAQGRGSFPGSSTFKNVEAFFLGFLMWYYDNFSVTAWVYLAMQGSYGIIWFIKDMAFPDPAWQKKITLAGI